MKHLIPVTLSETIEPRCRPSSMQAKPMRGPSRARTLRYAKPHTISWRFTSNDARSKLHDLYSVVKYKLN